MSFVNHVIIKENAVSLIREETKKDKVKGVRYSTSKRGSISSLSRSAVRRMKNFLADYIGDGLAFGLTCTIPFYEISQREWLLLVKRFRQNIIRLNICLVYRIELQQNGSPHLHCIGYADDYRTMQDCQFAWWCALRDICVDDEKYGQICLDQRDGCYLYSCSISRPSCDFHRWYRYLCGHASKHKESQLGYLGKQWGIINRKLFKPVSTDEYILNDKEYVRVLHRLKKVSKCKSKLGKYGRTDWFVNPEEIKNLVLDNIIKL